MLLPAGTIDCGTAKQHYSIGEVQSASTGILTQAGKTGYRGRTLAANRQISFTPHG